MKPLYLKKNNAIWEIISCLQPLVRNISKNSITGIVDEDMVSEINLTLYRRIKNFNIFL